MFRSIMRYFSQNRNIKRKLAFEHQGQEKVADFYDDVHDKPALQIIIGEF